MAEKIVCDVCGKDCTYDSRYELKYTCFLRTKKEDICYECMTKIKKIIKDKPDNTRRDDYDE